VITTASNFATPRLDARISPNAGVHYRAVEWSAGAAALIFRPGCQVLAFPTQRLNPSPGSPLRFQHPLPEWSGQPAYPKVAVAGWSGPARSRMWPRRPRTGQAAAGSPWALSSIGTLAARAWPLPPQARQWGSGGGNPQRHRSGKPGAGYRATALRPAPTRDARRVLPVRHRPSTRHLDSPKPSERCGRDCAYPARLTPLAPEGRPVPPASTAEESWANSWPARLECGCWAPGSAPGTEDCSTAQSATVTCRRIGSHTTALVTNTNRPPGTA